MRLLIASFAVLVLSFGSTTASDDKVHTSHSSFMSASNSLSSSNGFIVSFSQHNVNGNCMATLSIRGNGIKKDVEYPCDEKPQKVINLNKSLYVGDYFSDTPSVLVHILPSGCEKEIFTEKDGEITSSVEPMFAKDCEKVKVKIEVLKEEQVKWEEWARQQQIQAQQNLQQIQENLQNLHQNLFNNIFNGFVSFFG